MRFFKLYGVSRSFSIESKESQDLSNAPRPLIERLTNLTNDNSNNSNDFQCPNHSKKSKAESRTVQHML